MRARVLAIARGSLELSEVCCVSLGHEAALDGCTHVCRLPCAVPHRERAGRRTAEPQPSVGGHGCRGRCGSWRRPGRGVRGSSTFVPSGCAFRAPRHGSRPASAANSVPTGDHGTADGDGVAGWTPARRRFAIDRIVDRYFLLSTPRVPIDVPPHCVPARSGTPAPHALGRWAAVRWAARDVTPYCRTRTPWRTRVSCRVASM